MKRLSRKKAVVAGLLLLLLAMPLMACSWWDFMWDMMFGFPKVATTNNNNPYIPTPSITDGAIAFEAELLQWHLTSNAAKKEWNNVYDVNDPVWKSVINYWHSEGCNGSNPGGVCVDAATGNLQCATFVAGVFGAIGDALPAKGNGADYWGLYQGRSGWKEINNGQIKNGSESPKPGDIMAFGGGSQGFGHVAIVVKVQPPSGGKNGFITTANANMPGNINYGSEQAGNFVEYPWIQNEGIDASYIGSGFNLQGFIRQLKQPAVDISKIDIPGMPQVSKDRQKYLLLAEAAATKFEIPIVAFARQINQESGFNPDAKSSAGALGIAQFEPGTAAGIPTCVTEPDQPTNCAETDHRKGFNTSDPQASLYAGAYLMSQLYAHYLQYDCNGKPCVMPDVAYSRALGGYNAGQGATDGAVDRASNTWLHYLDLGQKDHQTRDYVCIIMGKQVAQESWIAEPIPCS